MKRPHSFDKVNKCPECDSEKWACYAVCWACYIDGVYAGAFAEGHAVGHDAGFNYGYEVGVESERERAAQARAGDTELRHIFDGLPNVRQTKPALD